ncbi:hypothetical protein IWZ00DRAFT_221219 [Phyllosticta capitalensis]|uniref:Uncharacterized protein n=1 Tax=Phyllosticta capitalensis TaxID=121624 RepID=A0ABR1YSX8_9PEZI
MPPPKPGTFYSLAHRCSSCANSSIPRRAFTSSAVSRATPAEPESKPEATPEAPMATSQIPPESPRYIDIPIQKQIKATKAPIIKGALPVPRNIFVTRSEIPKHTEEFIASATREPAREPITTGQHVAKTKYKAKLANIRRRSLRVGIANLHRRKERSDSKWATRGATRQEAQRALLSAPEPLDEQLTKTSVIKAVRNLMRGPRGRRTDAESTAIKRWNAERRQMMKTAERNDQLHTLYMHARDFIVTEEQLASKIDQVFGTEDHPADFYGHGGSTTFGRSIWAKDAPKNVSQMIGLRNQTAIKTDATVATHHRILKIAEELTGGKI